MGDKIKTAIEIAMEKAALLDDLSAEEKEDIENRKKIEPVMINFYRGTINPDELWGKLKDEKISLLRMAQSNLIDSLKFNLDNLELQRRVKAVIAIESLKKEQKTSLIQRSLSMLEDLIKKAESEKKQIYEQFKKAIESNPQARNRVIEQGGAKVMLKLSVEEAILQNPQWKQFITEFESNNEQQFFQIIQQIKQYI